jgi:small-conductance mechanosensitive channel
LQRSTTVELPHFDLPFLDPQTSQRVVLTLIALPLLLLLRSAVVAMVRATIAHHRNGRRVFWTRQAAALTTVVLALLIVSTIWFESPARVMTILGFAGAGLAFALQRTITAFVGYLIILRGNTFTVGDRISMGGVRGDVIDLGFLQTRIMEMGSPRDTQSTNNPIWVRDRQYTGRIVTVTNDKVFEDPVYNYTREFPFLWEEIGVPVTKADIRERVEAILLESAHNVTAERLQRAKLALANFQRHYVVDIESLDPKVYYHFDDGKLTLIVRFVTTIEDERDVKDAIKRKVVAGLHEAGFWGAEKVA